MSAEYDLRSQPSASLKEGKALLNPRLVSKGTILMDEIADEISRSSSFTHADVYGLLTALEHSMAKYISDGYHVKFGNIGYFWAKLQSRAVESEKEIHSQSISIGNVNFRASASFKKECNGSVLKSKDGFKSSKEISIDDCKSMVSNYLKNHHFLMLSDFCSMTGLLPGKGRIVINSLVDNHFLACSGKSTHKIYHLP